MILTTTFNLFANAFIIIFNALPNIPNYSQEIKEVIETFFNMIFSAGELIMFFLPPYWLCDKLITLSIIMEGFVIGYYITMWTLGKVPIINVK